MKPQRSLGKGRSLINRLVGVRQKDHTLTKRKKESILFWQNRAYNLAIVEYGRLKESQKKKIEKLEKSNLQLRAENKKLADKNRRLTDDNLQLSIALDSEK